MRHGRVRSAAASCAVAVTAMLGMLTIAPVPASAATEAVNGQVISIMCYEGHGQKGIGPAHLSCATSCAKKGYALGILVADGTYYQIAGPLTADDNVKLQPFLSTSVNAKGDVTEKDGKKTINIASLSDITSSK